jgi:hypothetical protein
MAGYVDCGIHVYGKRYDLTATFPVNNNLLRILAKESERHSKGRGL